MSENPFINVKKRQIPLKDTRPVKVYAVDLDETITREQVKGILLLEYTHWEFPDGQRFKIREIAQQCYGMRLDYFDVMDQYIWVAIMEPGWVPAVTHQPS